MPYTPAAGGLVVPEAQLRERAYPDPPRPGPVRHPHRAARAAPRRPADGRPAQRRLGVPGRAESPVRLPGPRARGAGVPQPPHGPLRAGRQRLPGPRPGERPLPRDRLPRHRPHPRTPAHPPRHPARRPDGPVFRRVRRVPVGRPTGLPRAGREHPDQPAHVLLARGDDDGGFRRPADQGLPGVHGVRLAAPEVAEAPLRPERDRPRRGHSACSCGARSDAIRPVPSGRTASAARSPGEYPSHPPREDLPGDLRRIARAGRHLAFFFSRSDPGYGLLDLYARREVDALRRAGGLSLYFFDDADHTFSRRAARLALVRAIADHLERRYPRPAERPQGLVEAKGDGPMSKDRPASRGPTK